MDENISLDILYADEGVPQELYILVRDGLSSQLHTRLHQIANSTQYLTALTWYNEEKVSLLMTAALNGHDDVVRVLLTHYNSAHQIELKGHIKIHELEKYIGGVTALYCACFRGHFNVAKTLIDVGNANVNQVTKYYPRYPLLIYAARLDRLDIVKFLIENKYADVNETKSTDGHECTALIWAVWRGHTSIVRYLIENGANVNYSCEAAYLSNRIPITSAAFLGSLDIVQLLYHAGAEVSRKDESAETLLMIAIERKHYSIVNFLLEQNVPTIHDLELAACYLMENEVWSNETTDLVIKLLKHALEQRAALNIPRTCIEPMDIYDYKQECPTIDEIDSIKNDPHRISIEILLIRERLHITHPDETIIQPFQKYAEQLANNGELLKSLNVYIRTFYLSHAMEIEPDLCYFVWIFCKMLTANQRIPVHSFIQICDLIIISLHGKHTTAMLNNTLFLIVIATKILTQGEITKEQKTSIYRWIQDLCRERLTTKHGQTLLHLCVDKRTNNNLTHRSRDTTSHIKFPNEPTFQLLLTLGSRWLDVDATESLNGNTPLHIVCQESKDENIIKLLLNYGCHVDCVNRHGKIPADYVHLPQTKSLLTSQSTPNRLKCICAGLIAKDHLNTDTLGPSMSTLNKFIVLHGCLHTSSDDD